MAAQKLADRTTEVYAPPRRSYQVWRGVVDWMGFLLEVLFQIFRGTTLCLPYSFVLRLLSRSSSSSSSSSSLSFIPLTVVEHSVDESDVSTGDIVPRQKLTVVLDLDETLVSAYESSSLPSVVKTKAIEAGLSWFELECVSSDKEYDGKPGISYVTVFERPGLREFLKRVSEFAELVLFTAGLEGYASPLVDVIDAENRFNLRLYRPSTVSTGYREHVKDLCCISKDLSRVVIVDNNPFSFVLQPSNGIPCVPFSAREPYDNQLLEVLLPLLKSLSLIKDVRPLLNERFHMPEWFQMHGIPPSNCGSVRHQV